MGTRYNQYNNSSSKQLRDFNQLQSSTAAAAFNRPGQTHKTMQGEKTVSQGILHGDDSAARNFTVRRCIQSSTLFTRYANLQGSRHSVRNNKTRTSTRYVYTSSLTNKRTIPIWPKTCNHRFVSDENTKQRRFHPLANVV